MPGYTYRCEQCGKELYLLRSIAERDTPEVRCTCGGDIQRAPDAPVGKVQGGTPRFHK